MYQLIAFFVFSAGIIYISRASLLAPRSHGFHRFWAWEFLLALTLLNITKWFRAPLSWHQIISWILLFASLIPLYFGVRTLVAKGKPTARREDDQELLAFEKTSALVTTGIYHYIRHPLYSSLMFLTWGVFFKSPAWIGFGLAFAASLFLVATAKADERECISFFGADYQEYMKKTKMFVPFVF
jgi:protein-S-isoprenylcysteine O-methyltransferase Ste14